MFQYCCLNAMLTVWKIVLKINHRKGRMLHGNVKEYVDRSGKSKRARERILFSKESGRECNARGFLAGGS